MNKLILVIFLLGFTVQGWSVDTTKVLRYTEALSEKMDFPAVRIKFNGDYIFSDEEMASFKILSIAENHIAIEKEGGMNSHHYSFHTFKTKKKRYIIAINLRSGSSGSSRIKCFELLEKEHGIELIEAADMAPEIEVSSFGVNKEDAALFLDRSDLFYFVPVFNESKNIEVTVTVNPPFGKENQEIIEKFSIDYPTLFDQKMTYIWSQRKGGFELKKKEK